MGKPARRNWKRIVELWQESGLSKTDFCRQNNVPKRKFSYYSIKFEAFSATAKTVETARPAVKPEKNNGGNFAKVVCSTRASVPPVHPEPLILRLDCGASIEVSSDFDPEILRKILKVAASL